MKRLINVNSFLIFFSFLLGMSCTNKVYDAEKLTSIADSCYKADNSLQALQYYIKGFIAARKESNDYLAMRCAGHISILYNSFGNVDGSLQYNKLGYDLAIKLADDDAKSSFLSNYVTYCCNNKDSVNARKYYAELLRLPVHRDKQKYEYFCLYEYARIMKCVGNYSEAQNVHSQALEYARKNKMGAVYILFQNSEIGNLMVLQHKYDKAVVIGKSCLAEALRLNYKELILNSYKMLADAYVGLGEKDEAYEYLEKYHKQSTGVYNMTKYFSLQNDLYQYENVEHERRVSNLVIVIILITAMAVVLVFLLFVIIIKNQALRKAQVIVVNKDQEILKLEQKNNNLSEAVDNQLSRNTSYAMPVDQKDELFMKIKSIFEDLYIISDVDFNINKMAEYVGSNVKYVSVVINEKFGKGFKVILNEYRVKQACKMLSDDNYDRFTIKTIFESVGYRNAASFNRAFKSVMGMTPSTYQKIYRHEADAEIEE